MSIAQLLNQLDHSPSNSLQLKAERDCVPFGQLALRWANKQLPLGIYKTNAGFYVGTYDHEGPVSRESEYFANEQLARAALCHNTFNQRVSP